MVVTSKKIWDLNTDLIVFYRIFEWYNAVKILAKFEML